MGEIRDERCTGNILVQRAPVPSYIFPPTIIKVNCPHTSKMTQEIPTITTTERKRDHFPTVDEASFLCTQHI